MVALHRTLLLMDMRFIKVCDQSGLLGRLQGLQINISSGEYLCSKCAVNWYVCFTVRVGIPMTCIQGLCRLVIPSKLIRTHLVSVQVTQGCYVCEFRQEYSQIHCMYHSAA